LVLLRPLFLSPIELSGTYHELLTLFEPPQEGSQSTNIHCVGEDGHEVVQDTGNFAEHGPDPLSTLGDLDVQQLLDGQRKALLIGHHRDVVQTIEVRQGLHVGLVLDQLLGTTVKQTDVGIGANNFLAIEFQNQTKHTVSSRMLGTKVDGVVTNLAAQAFSLGFEGSSLLSIRSGRLVRKVAERRVRRDQSGGRVAGSFSIAAGDGGRYETGARHACVEEGGGADTEPFGRIAQASEGGGHGDG